MINAMNHGFSFKNSRYPIENFLNITLAENRASLRKYVEAKSIVIDSDFIVFSKTNSNALLVKVKLSKYK